MPLLFFILVMPNIVFNGMQQIQVSLRSRRFKELLSISLVFQLLPVESSSVYNFIVSSQEYCVLGKTIKEEVTNTINFKVGWKF